MVKPNLPGFHVIRLHGPWTAEVSECWSGQEPGPEPGRSGLRCQLPRAGVDLLGPGFAGRVKLVRPFGKPTGLEPDQEVYLQVVGGAFPATVVVNGRDLGCVSPAEPGRFSLQELLAARNRLEIVVQIGSPSGSDGSHRSDQPLLGSIQLEISDPGVQG